MAAGKLAEDQSEVHWKVWLRVFLGGERRIDVAHSLGYKDGSTVTQILKRLESKLEGQPSFTRHSVSLQSKFKELLSSIKS